MEDYKAIVTEWGEQHFWLVEACFAFIATVVLLLVWIKCQRLLLKRSKQSATPWDNILLQAFNLPLTVLIIVLGIQKIAESFARFLSDYPSVIEFFEGIRAAAIIIAIFWVLLRLVSGLERQYRRKKLTVGDKEIDSGTIHSIFRVLRAIIFTVAVLTAINSVGISISGILAFSGVGGVIIGFAAKDTLSNFFSGLLIFWERPFVIGDWIRRPDTNIEGIVESIGWRMTQIRTFDQRPLYVPNSLFFNSVIENPQRMTNRRVYEYMGLRYDDIDRLPQVLEDIRQMLSAHPDVDQDKIQMVNFDRYGASSLDFFIYVMTKTTDWKKFHQAKEDILLKIAALVSQHGCQFAFPTHTLHHATPAPPELPPVGH